MASFHMSVKIGGKGKGAAHAAYISREGKYAKGKRYEDLEYGESGNMPSWACDNPIEFWKVADEHERSNGSVYREIEVALPRELTPEQRRELVQEFVKKQCSTQHTYTFAIHTPKAALEGEEQPHAHIMYCERINDGIERSSEQYFKRYNGKAPENGGARKKTGLNPKGKTIDELKQELIQERENWATLQNEHLAKHGHNVTVDHRSNIERGIDASAEKHLGGKGIRNLSKNDKNILLEYRSSKKAVNEAIFESEKLVKAPAIKLDLSAGIAAARANREKWQAEKARQQALEVSAKEEQERQRKAEIQAEKEQSKKQDRGRGM